MRRSTTKILTTHVGALPGPLETWEGEAGDVGAARGRRATSSPRSSRPAPTSSTKASSRKAATGSRSSTRASSGFVGVPAEGTVALLRSSADWQEFDDFYAKAMAGGTLFEQTASVPDADLGESATGCAASRFATRASRPSRARSSC